jgi:hypothetical protein
MAFPEKNYTLGTGKVYFDQFAQGTLVGTGQRYFGNTPEFSLSSESEVLDHFDADNGIRQKDDSVLLELNRTGEFVTDHISPENLALFFLGSNDVLVQAAAVGATDAFADVAVNRRYQLGVSPSNPAGVRGVTNVVVEVGAATMVLNTDYTLDAATGGITILDAGINAGDDVDVTYDVSSASYNQVVSSANAELYGALFFQGTNPKGVIFDYYFPYVVIRPNGDFQLKSADEWQQLSFSIEILKLDDNTEAIYINGRAGVGI